MKLSIHPLTPERFSDLERLFGPRGAVGGCWCMAWRFSRAEYDNNKGEGNRRAFKAIVAAGPPPGVIAYDAAVPIGWCAVAPREEYPVLARSRVLRKVDEQPVWSVSCFFIAKGHRRKGVSVQLLRAAVDFARTQGASIVEGYPVEPVKTEVPSVFAWTGLAPTFRKVGFKEVLRRSETRPIMRYVL